MTCQLRVRQDKLFICHSAQYGRTVNVTFFGMVNCYLQVVIKNSISTTDNNNDQSFCRTDGQCYQRSVIITMMSIACFLPLVVK